MLKIGSITCFVCFLMLCFAGTQAFSQSSSELSLSGPVVQGGMLIGHTQPNAQVSLDGVRLPVDEQGYFVLGFGRDAEKSQLLSIRIEQQAPIERILTPAPRAYDIERVNGLPPNTVNPPQAVLERISREGSLVAVARQARDQRSDWRQSFAMPAEGRISGVYGSQRVLNGEPKRPHFGLDIAAPTGSPVTAPAAGKVTLAEPDLYYSGGTVIIDHGHGVSSTFLHMSKVDVQVGQYLQQGDYVGAIGATGRATGPHLDWRMNWRDQRIDPMLLIDPDNWKPTH